jgi:hypothetical protein
MKEEDLNNDFRFQALIDVVTHRLDGHGQDIRAFSGEMREVRKDFQKFIEKMTDKMQDIKDRCNDRHSTAMIKIAGISAFISGIITTIAYFLKK